MPLTALQTITQILLDESSSKSALKQSLDELAELCGKIGGVQPNPSYSAWAEDTFLNTGVAINPEAAAQCLKDYRRSVVFIRGVYGALQELKSRKANKPIRILYAGCGPYATLLLPLLSEFSTSELSIHLLDIHQDSLDSVTLLLPFFKLTEYDIKFIQDDACHYQHATPLDLIISETMQKSLEQEPQFTVTTNLGPQLCEGGIFIPEEIQVSFAFVSDDPMQTKPEYSSIKSLLSLSASNADELKQSAYASTQGACRTLEQNVTPSLQLGQLSIPQPLIKAHYPALITEIKVYKHHTLTSHESDITLPRRCFEMEPLSAEKAYNISYQIGQYPHFSFS